MPAALPSPQILAKPVQPEAAISFWAWKTALPYDEVKKLAEGAKERAFYVAGLAERDAVEAIKEALGDALKNGTGLEEFKRQCADVMGSEGWRDSRVETIFRNNMQSAYSAGRYQKMQAVKDTRPYWQYIIVDDGRARPEHAILRDQIYPADHEFWKTNYPPNGHKCRCGVRTLSARQVEEQGLTVQEEMPGDSMYTDPETGMEYHVARPGADDGWRGNPGRDWLNGLDLKKYGDLTPESYKQQRGNADE